MPRHKQDEQQEAPAEAVESKVITATVEALAAERGMAPGEKDSWKFAAAKAHNRWPQGKELTAQEFDDAVHAAINSSIQ